MDGDKKSSKKVEFSISTGTFVRFWLVILGFVLLGGFIYLARKPLVLLAVSFFLALVLNRPVTFLAKHMPGKSRTLGILVAYLIIAAIIALFLSTVLPLLVRHTVSFLSNVPELIQQTHQQSGWLNNILKKYHLTKQFNTWSGSLQGSIDNLSKSMGQSMLTMMQNLASWVGDLIIVIFATFFMLVEGPSWEEKFWRLAYTNPAKRRHHKDLAKQMYNVVSGYVVGQATVGLISATFTAIFVIILALCFKFDISIVWPAWMTIFLMVFVPMFGAFIGGTIVALLLVMYSLPAAIIYVILFVIEQQIENNIIQPHIQSKHMEISALTVLVALIVGMNVGGLLGALVAIPVAGCLVVLARDFVGHRRKDDAAKIAIDHDNDIDGVLDSTEPVIFVPPKKKVTPAKINIASNDNDNINKE